jgi:hypothetical protein
LYCNVFFCNCIFLVVYSAYLFKHCIWHLHVYRFWRRSGRWWITGYHRWETKNSWCHWLVNRKLLHVDFLAESPFQFLTRILHLFFLQYWEWWYWYLEGREGWCRWLYFWGIRLVLGNINKAVNTNHRETFFNIV